MTPKENIDLIQSMNPNSKQSQEVTALMLRAQSYADKSIHLNKQAREEMFMARDILKVDKGGFYPSTRKHRHMPYACSKTVGL